MATTKYPVGSINNPGIVTLTKPKPKKKRGYGKASDGRTGRSSGGSIRAKLSSGGPVAKAN